MGSILIEDAKQFERLSGHGRLMMVRFTMPGSTKSLVLGIKVPQRQVNRAFCDLRERMPVASSDAVLAALAINAVKVMLIERGLPAFQAITGKWSARRSSIAELEAEQRRLSETPLDAEGRRFATMFEIFNHS